MILPHRAQPYRTRFADLPKHLGIPPSTLLMDFGDAACFTSGDKVLDLSGGGYDFYRGSSASGDAAEPTFNGVAGSLSRSEFFGFSTDDYLLYDTTNEPFITAINKDNALVSISAWVQFPNSAGNYAVLCTWAGGVTVGFMFRVQVGHLHFHVVNGAGTSVSPVSALSTIINAPMRIGVVVDEAAGTGFFSMNGQTETFVSTYASPTASDPANPMRVGIQTNGGGNFWPVGSKCWGFEITSGYARTQAQDRALFNAQRARLF